MTKAMETFATVDEYEKRYGEVNEDEKDLLTEILMDATCLIASELKQANISIDDEQAAGSRMRVCRAVAFRAMAQEENPSVPVGATQFSQSVGVYTESFSIGNAYRDVYLTKAEKRMLGIGRARIAFIAPKGATDDS